MRVFSYKRVPVIAAAFLALFACLPLFADAEPDSLRVVTEIEVDSDGVHISLDGSGFIAPEDLEDLDRQIDDAADLEEDDPADADVEGPFRAHGRIRVSNDDRVAVGGSVRVRAEEAVQGDVVAVGGRVDVYGTVTGDVVAVGGGVHLWDGAVVEGDAVSVGGRVQVDNDASLCGERISINVGLGHLFSGDGLLPMGRYETPSFAGPLQSLVWMAVLVLFAAAFYAVAGRRVEVMSRRIEEEPGRSFLIGFLGSLASPIAVGGAALLLLISIVGILLLPALAIGVAVVAFIGCLGAWLAAGRRLCALRSADGLATACGPYRMILVGILGVHAFSILSSLLGLLPWLGPIPGLVEFAGNVVVLVAAIVGFGALLSTRFGSSPAALPPPAPGYAPPPSAPASPPPPVPPPPIAPEAPSGEEEDDGKDAPA
jgi:hypothetical protein